MSLRNVKKLQEAKLSQENSDQSDNEYEPPCVKKSSRSTYAGLVVSSTSEEESNSEIDALLEKEKSSADESKGLEKDVSHPGPSKSQLKLEKKKRKKQKKNKTHDFLEDDTLDEVELSVKAVNSLLGEPESKEETQLKSETKEQEKRKALFSVKRCHISSANKMERIFGRDTDGSPRRTVPVRPKAGRLSKCLIIEHQMKLVKLGLSMSLLQREPDVVRFIFEHNKEYQKLHNEFLTMIETSSSEIVAAMIDISLKYMHIEGLIEAADLMFLVENSSDGNKLVEQCIAYMQFIAHPSFNILDPRTRLEYKHVENRAFHIMLLKYVHLLSNRACHRTALELAKVLLNLDPTDPLAAVFVIDVLSFRSKRLPWLLEVIEYFEENNMNTFMFNLTFSKALALFKLSEPNSENRTQSNKYLKSALKQYPCFLAQIVRQTNHSTQTVHTHELYREYSNKITPKCLKESVGLYIAFTAQYWHDRYTLAWLVKNAQELAESYDEDVSIKEAIFKAATINKVEFRQMPDRLHRHLAIINAMSGLLIEKPMPNISCIHSYDPVPPSDSVNRPDFEDEPEFEDEEEDTVESSSDGE